METPTKILKKTYKNEFKTNSSSACCSFQLYTISFKPCTSNACRHGNLMLPKKFRIILPSFSRKLKLKHITYEMILMSFFVLFCCISSDFVLQSYTAVFYVPTNVFGKNLGNYCHFLRTYKFINLSYFLVNSNTKYSYTIEFFIYLVNVLFG